MIGTPPSSSSTGSGAFASLSPLVGDVDRTFGQFYDELLSNQIFARHFTDRDTVKRLLVMQKQNFIESLQDSREELFERYYKIGVIHFSRDIPYEVFLSGTQLLQDNFDDFTIQSDGDSNLIYLCREYFSFVSEAMAKGYLDEFIKENSQDVINMMELVDSSTFGRERRLLRSHFDWLLDLFSAVATENYDEIERLSGESLQISGSVYEFIMQHGRELMDVYDEQTLERIRFRVVSNTASMLFYLKRKVYSEALSLIINILEVYKLTLILDNIINNIIVKKAESVIEETTRLSETDPLTNVMNRRKLEEMLENLLLRSVRTSLPLTVCILDIDDFKSVNDRFGHHTGDVVLSKTAALIKKMVREHDFVIRYGGEEFLVIFCDTALNNAKIVAEKIRETIAGHSFEKAGKLTVSLGMAEYNSDDDQHQLLERADKNLYQAKATGKDRVCL